MFAGPNGSGKSTLKSVLLPELLGVHLNPDEIEATIKATGRLSLTDYGVTATSAMLSIPARFKQFCGQRWHGRPAHVSKPTGGTRPPSHSRPARRPRRPTSHQ